ncbi:hypothetical protein JW698_01210 [Candidatus Wolfebacteria bacterium]|nr:hypothetical protein [Candidatus Wolfebacteria bacterium]
MKKTTKILLISFVFMSLFSAISFNVPALAEEYDFNKAAEELAEGSPIDDPDDVFVILAKIVKYTYTIFFIIAIIFIIIAAFNFLTGGDQPEKIKSAKNQIFWAVIAIAIALISTGAAQIIKSFITNN